LPVTEKISDQLVRLPFHNGLSKSDQEQVLDAILWFSFFVKTLRSSPDAPRNWFRQSCGALVISPLYNNRLSNSAW
jgi:hypothetical protein